MSISASIDITLIRNEKYNFSATDLLDSMLRQNWKVENKGKICFLPLGDDDMFEWSDKKIEEQEFKKIIQNKESRKETIGIVFYWQDTEIGVSVLIFQDYQVSFTLNINRIKVDTSDRFDITDVSWYFQRILPCFDDEIFKIGEVKFNQTW